MFGWFQPKCPVDEEDRLWIERRMTWLSDEFGVDRLLDATVVLPTDEFFPEAYEPTARGVRTLMDRVCEYMRIDPGRVDLEFFSQHKPVAFNVELVDARTGAAGIYDEQSGRSTIWLEASTLADPANVVATLAHELGHVHLLGDRRLSGEEPDHEPLTDLLSVFLGLGVFSANSVIRDTCWREGGWEGWQISRQGYLTAPLYGYALALFAWYRGEANPAWARHLRLDVRSPLETSLRYLDSNRAPTLPQRRSGPALPPGAFPAQDARASACCSVASHEHDDDLAGLDPDSADACVARGVAYAHDGQWDEAVREYTEAISLDPEDGEAYLLRGQAHLRRERYREALDDAEHAVRLDPEEIEAYRLRGLARYLTNDPHRAAEDFDFILGEEPKDVDACFWRGLACLAQREYARAVDDLSRVIRVSPQHVDAYLARAQAYEQLGQLDQARADREEAEYRAARLTAE